MPRNERRPFFNGPVGGYGAPFGLTTDMRYLCNCSDNAYHSHAGQADQAVHEGLLGCS